MERIRARIAGDHNLFPPHAMQSQGKAKTDTKGTIGAISGIPVGRVFDNRKELSAEKVHGPPYAGIWGSSKGDNPMGAYSVILSGGYDDDLDNGETVIYTGAGGRDKAGQKFFGGNKSQTKDQSFEHNNNRALQISAERRTPVRLIRQLTTSTGVTYYRYDGLYDVISAELREGKSGYQICQFMFMRQDGQAPLPHIGFPDAIPSSASGWRQSRSSLSPDLE